MPSKKTAAPKSAPTITGADALLDAAATGAQPGQEPELPPPPPDSGLPIPEQAQSPDPGPGAVRDAPIRDLSDARELPDVTGGVYVRAEFDSPLAIRAFKDHDGRSMAVVWTGYTLAKAAITD